jgi:hypothetical protein
MQKAPEVLPLTCVQQRHLLRLCCLQFKVPAHAPPGTARTYDFLEAVLEQVCLLVVLPTLQAAQPVLM